MPSRQAEHDVAAPSLVLGRDHAERLKAHQRPRQIMFAQTVTSPRSRDNGLGDRVLGAEPVLAKDVHDREFGAKGIEVHCVLLVRCVAIDRVGTIAVGDH